MWLGSNSGSDPTTYTDLSDSEEEKWTLDWTHMGIHDVPAMINKIKEVSGADKVTYIGYSQGNALMHYGLSKLEDDFYSANLARFISMATCVFDQGRSGSWKKSARKWKKFYKAGVYHAGGDLEETAEKICERWGWESNPCEEAWWEAEDDEEHIGRHAWDNEIYNDQIWIMKRWQEPIPYEDWVKPVSKGGVRETELVDDNVTTVPLTFFVAKDDDLCPPQMNKSLFEHASVQEKFWYEQPNADHSFFHIIDGNTFLSKVVAAIETGDPQDW